MTLDPQAKAFLGLMNGIKKEPMRALGAEKARAAYADRPAYIAPAYVEMFKVDDKTIAGKDAAIPVRFYTPQSSAQPLAVTVFYHGGGMVIGSLDSYDTLCRQIAIQAGCIVVSVDYRLAPEHKFPAAVNDAYDALEWVMNNTEAIGGDKNNIAVCGDSAGGNLAAVVSLLMRDIQQPALKCQILIYPATADIADSGSSVEFGQGYFLERDTILWFQECYLATEDNKKDFRYAPLLAENLEALPPALIIVASYDPLRDEGVAYAERLKASGCTVELQEYTGMFHPFVSLAGVLDEGKHAIEAIAKTLRFYFANT